MLHLLAALLLTLPNGGQGRVSSCTDGASWTVNVNLVDNVGFDTYGTDWTLLIGYRDDEVIDGNDPNWWDIAGRDSLDALRATIGWGPLHDPKWITRGGSMFSWPDTTLIGDAPESVQGGQITVSVPLTFPTLDGIDVWAVGADGTYVPLCQAKGPNYNCPAAGQNKVKGNAKKASLTGKPTFGKVKSIYR